MRGLTLLALCVALAGLAALAACAHPAPRPPSGPAVSRAAAPARERVRLLYTSQGAANAPLWLAQEGGHFLANGLDVDLTFVSGSATATQALLAGEGELVAQGGAATVAAALNGADTLLVATTHGSFIYAIAGAPGLAGLDALRGGTLGLTRFGTTMDYAARLALHQAGLEPGADVAIVQTGGNAETLAALGSGAIQAALVSEAYGFELRQQGYPWLLDLADPPIEYPHHALATTRGFVAERPDTVRRVLRAVLQGMGQFVRQPERAKQVLASHSQLADPATLELIWQAHATKHLKRVPYTAPTAVQRVLDELATRDDRAATAAPESFYDNRFVRELDDSGFIAKVYQSS
ncbi:MAG TPA: ABC transporter substrate-binding protein [Chloroflexota bacterium]|jgi:NitT/TauT family transport system substrate-binding protein